MPSPLASALRSIIEHVVPVDPYAHYECQVLSQNSDGTLECKPTDQRLGKGLSRVVLDLGPGVDAVKIAGGGTVMVSFKNGDRQQPRATWIKDGILELVLKAQSKITIDAPQIEIGKTASLVSLGKGLKPIASAGDTVQTVPATGKGTIDSTINQTVKV